MKLFDRFYEAVAGHYRESHEVQFYANLFCVSPKYFSTVIRQATGATPSEWIARFVVVKAKLLMRTTDLSMLRISQELGFPGLSSDGLSLEALRMKRSRNEHLTHFFSFFDDVEAALSGRGAASLEVVGDALPAVC